MRALDRILKGRGGSQLLPLVALIRGMFRNGEQGTWYDPSDLTTLFQDSAGTTPVTAVEQPVGLMLDKSKGLVATATSIDGNMDTATWTKGTGWTATGPRSLTFSAGTGADCGASYAKPTSAAIRWTFTIAAISGSLDVYPTSAVPKSYTTTGTKVVFSDAGSNFNIFRMSAGSCTITDIRIEVIPGNHAFQSTSASRPVLSARVNLLTKTEQFDNAAFVKTNSSVTANSTTAPDGTLTADTLTASGTLGQHGLNINPAFTGVRTLSFFIKAGTNDFVQLMYGSDVNAFANFNVALGTLGTVGSAATASITPAANGFYRCSISTSSGTATNDLYLNIVTSATAVRYESNSLATTLFIWGAQLELGSTATTYQRVNTSTDYDTAGFPLYLKTDGVDDWMQTNSINFTSTDKMTVWAGVRKLSDAATGMFLELSAIVGANNGTFYISAPEIGATYGIRTKGTVDVTGYNHATFTAPLTNVLAISLNNGGSGGTATNCVASRFNGVANTTGGTSSVTTAGNFGNYPLYLFRRGGTSLPFNGCMYGLIVRGAQSTGTQISNGEKYVNSKTKAF